MLHPDYYPLAYIQSTRHELVEGRGYETYAWDGDPARPVAISRSLMEQQPDLLRRLPWRLIHVDYDLLSHTDIFVRADQYGLLTLGTVLRAKLANLYVSVQARIVVTAMVWGLAYVEPGVLPCWKHLGKRQT